MLNALRRSRGYGKLRRNRPAVVALWIIAAYFAVAGWIFVTEWADWAGERTGAFRLGGVPVLGAMLPDRTLDRVGPRWLSAFGVPQGPQRREDQADFVFKRVDAALAELDRLAVTDPRLVETALAQHALAERRIAPVPLPELRARRDAARAAFATLDALKRSLSLGTTLLQQLDSARLRLGALGAPPADPADHAQAAGLAADAIEDAMFSLEDLLGDSAGLTGLLSNAGLPGLDPAAIAAGLARQPPAGAAPADLQGHADTVRQASAGALDTGPARAALSAAESMAQGHTAVLAGARAAALDHAARSVEGLMPVPAGLDGLVYRLRVLLGTDAQGRSILLRSVYSAKVAVQVGVVTAVVSVLVGALLGAAAAFFGGWVDNAVQWLYSTFSSIPNLVLLVVLAFMFTGTPAEGTLIPIYAAFCLTFWIGPCRVIRGETLKIKELEYVQAARALGFSRVSVLLRQVIPNTTHLMFISFSLLFINAVKSEVVLTFLGIGLKNGASWGLMISQSGAEVVIGLFWQIGAATAFMVALVLAFNVLSDALQDAFDPRHVG